MAEYAAKKEGKVKLAAKSVVTMDVKPWDDETDMKELEKSVRSIEMDGLVWGGSKLVPVGYGVSKLQINLVIEDDKVGLDDLQDAIAEFEDYVQSSDVSLLLLRCSTLVLIKLDCCHAEIVGICSRLLRPQHNLSQNPHRTQSIQLFLSLILSCVTRQIPPAGVP